MGGHDCTPTEAERIARDEELYADDFWRTCSECNGSGENRDGTKCLECRGDGEILITNDERVGGS